MKKLLVVVHDAGGAEIIAAYLKAKLRPQEYVVYAAGPAAKIFTREKISHKPAPQARAALTRLMNTAAYKALLTATGWMTNIERDALALAKEAGMKTCVYLESWNRYRERFGYPAKGWKGNLPDEIWVGDRDAEALAQTYFPQTRIRFIANEYFKAIITRITAAPSTSSKEILYMSDVGPGGERALEEFLQALVLQGEKTKLRIRFHPADDRSRYDVLIRRYVKNLMIQKSTEKDIARDLARASVVVGVETVALVVALIARKRVICLPRPGVKSYLPQKVLLRPKTAKEAVRLITKT